MSRYYLRGVLLAVLAFAACAGERPPVPAPRAEPYAEDDFAARAAALQKTCELVAIYVGTDNRRGAEVAAHGRAEALEGVRRAPDPLRGVAFARAYESLDAAATTLKGAGDYAPPLTASECERLRGSLLAAAEELKPLGEPYYLKIARKYEPPGRPPRIIWGPLPPATGPTGKALPAPPSLAASAEAAPSSAETAAAPPAPAPPGTGE